MSLETMLVSALGPLVGGRVYPDTAPAGAEWPYIVYQQVGGRALNPINGAAPGLRNARVQVNAWAATRLAASALMHLVEDTLRAAPVHAAALGALQARLDASGGLRGAQQDFSVWHP